MREFEYLNKVFLPLFKEAISSGSIQKVQDILVKNGGLLVSQPCYWCDGFKIAKQSNNKEMLRFLMEQSCDSELLTKANPIVYATTPLHWAVSNGDVNLIKLFIDEDFDCKFLDGLKQLPLSKAHSYNGLESLKLILEHKERFGEDKDYVDLLVKCAQDDDARHILLLLKNGVSVITSDKKRYECFTSNGF